MRGQERLTNPDKNETRKTRYFSDFALRHMKEMRVLAKGGALGKENAEWRNVSEHCLAETVGADILAEALGADREKVVTAVLLHDWNKRTEIETMTQHGAEEGYKEVTANGERLLRNYGVPEDVVTLSQSNILKSANRNDWLNLPIEAKIVYFIDVITSGTKFVGFEERLRLAAQKPNTVELSEGFRSTYGGKSLLQVQAEASSLIQKELEDLLHLEPGTLIDFIMRKLEERIQTY